MRTLTPCEVPYWALMAPTAASHTSAVREMRCCGVGKVCACVCVGGGGRCSVRAVSTNTAVVEVVDVGRG